MAGPDDPSVWFATYRFPSGDLVAGPDRLSDPAMIAERPDLAVRADVNEWCVAVSWEQGDGVTRDVWGVTGWIRR